MLAWDTCTDYGVVALAMGARVIGGSRFRTLKGHAGWLMPLIDAAVKEAGRLPTDIDVIAAGIGPGGYTGVKVGVSTAKAMALALEAPLVGVPTLDLLAAHAPAGAAHVLSCMDARQGLVYAAGYRAEDGRLKRMTEYLCLEPGEIAPLVADMEAPHVAAVGHVPQGAVEAAQAAGINLSVTAADPVGFPSAEKLIGLACEMLERGEAGDAFTIVPVYLKKPV